MGVYVEWDNDSCTVVRQTFEDRWPYTEWQTAEGSICAMIDEVPWAVDIVYDGRAAQPKDFLHSVIYSFYFNGTCWKHPMAGRVAIIPPAQVFNEVDHFVNMVGDVKPDELGWRMRVYFSLDEAREALNGV